MRSPSPDGLVKRIVRMEEQIRQLRLRRRGNAELGPWEPLAPLIQPEFDDAFAGFSDRQCEYRTDGVRAFLRGILYCNTDGAKDILAGLVAAGIAPARPEVTRLFAPLLFNNMALTASSVTSGFAVSFNNVGVGTPGNVMFLEQSDPKLVDFTADPIAYKPPGTAHDGHASEGDEIGLDGLWWWIA